MAKIIHFLVDPSNKYWNKEALTQVPWVLLGIRYSLFARFGHFGESLELAASMNGSIS